MLHTEVWRCLEISFAAKKTYSDPLLAEPCEMDAVFTHSGGTRIKRPAFWDGGDIFKVRFAPTLTGIWTYETFSNDDDSLNGLSGTVESGEYTGTLEIYKRGFIKSEPGKRYLTYSDNTPFFYLGDTHWSLPFEAFESSNAAGIPSQFKAIIDERVKQGFTIIQSEPIQAANNTGKDEVYSLESFGEHVLGGFKNLDRKFEYIAEAGLVHANAQLFFAAELVHSKAYTEDYLKKLTRYWVARYGAYPVMWTCAQEVDNDFYYDREGDQKVFDAKNNPWKHVMQAIYENDAYAHPLSAHMEYASGTAPRDGHGTIASNSSFKDMPGHTWFACQWSPSKNELLDFRVPRDFWENEPPRPTVNYEGHYDHFWTDTKGARMQGWTAYLNGMFGYGYGAAGIWLIVNSYPDDLAGSYDLDRDTDNFITKEVKRMPWNEAMLLPAAGQLGIHMRAFFEKLEWHKLTPRFDDRNYGKLHRSMYSLATIKNDVYVCYFYNTNTATGTLCGMETQGVYTAGFYNPRDGEYIDLGEITPDGGEYMIPDKPDGEDWVLLVVKK